MYRTSEPVERTSESGHEESTCVGCADRVRVWIVACLCALALYVATMAPGVLWGDSGDAQIRVLAGVLRDPRELARAHVTYYAVAIGLHRLTGGDAAWMANLVAALAGAVTVANFAWLLTHVVRRWVSMVAGAAMLLLSHTLWQLSTGAEVVTFSTMCLSFEVAAIVTYLAARKPVWLVLAALVNGIGWSTHNLAMLTWPAYGVLMVLEFRRRPAVRIMAAAGAAWLIGVLPLAVLAGMAYAETGSASETLGSLLVGRYKDEVLNVDASLGTAAEVLLYIAMNFPTPLILLVPWGWWRLRRSAAWGTWWFLTVAACTYGLFAVRYDVPDQYTFFVHAYLFLVLFAAAGVEGVLDRWPSGRVRVVVLILSVLSPLAYAVAPSIARAIPATRAFFPAREIPHREPYAWFLRPWRMGYYGAERYACEVFEVLPPGAVLIIDEMMRPPLIYLQGRDRVRPDVTIPEPRYQWSWQRPLELNSARAAPLIESGVLYAATHTPSSLPRWLRAGLYIFEPATGVPAGHLFRVAFSVHAEP